MRRATVFVTSHARCQVPARSVPRDRTRKPSDRTARTTTTARHHRGLLTPYVPRAQTTMATLNATAFTATAPEWTASVQVASSTSDLAHPAAPPEQWMRLAATT